MLKIVPRKTRVTRVADARTRTDALTVLRSTYEIEKGWVGQAESQLPESDLTSPQVSWFLAYRGQTPAGVLRVYYQPPIAQYQDYDITFLDPGLDVDALLGDTPIAEVGRFAIIPRLRRNPLIAIALMRAATRETLERGFTHLITDVFEDDPHSPLGFHTRVLGFAPVATHAHGELNCQSRRITMVLDLKAAYQRLRKRKNWVFRTLTADWDEGLHCRLAV